MVRYQPSGKNTIVHLQRVRGLVAGFVFILLMVRFADARDFFSNQYGMPCKQCHTKIPNLNELGQNFKTNGHSFEKKAPIPKETAAPPPLSSNADNKGKANEKGTEDSTLETPPLQMPAKPEYLFRWRTQDGTYNISDSPMDTNSANTAAIKKNAGSSKKSRSRAGGTSKSVFPGNTKKKNPEGKSEAPKNGEIKNAVAQQPVSVAKPQPRDFEECMGKILINVVQPENGKEMMEQFERAERNCAPYATTR